MFRILLILFIVVPALELWGIIAVGKVIGGWPTVLLIIATGMIGAWLAKKQGLQVMRTLQLQLSRGEMPTLTILEGALVLVGSVLLLTPGFLSDVLGLLMLLPYTRLILAHLLKKWLWRLISTGKINLLFRR
ncbi:FxsA family protein [Brevibacillus migulae]|uniref:FxsA family protein n=1 Tax=Brevibacillus migulae TaxID=1644114 RepID=UPI00106E41ED|nr:FxsA family protein [Brevibacillus migulae]